MGVLVGDLRDHHLGPPRCRHQLRWAQLNELYVIAAAVIGGTSLAGGVGTIYGAMLGALLMQSLQSGMTLLNFESAYKNIVVGVVLVLAVFVDQVYRRRVK